MAASIKSTSKQTRQNPQKLPTIPTVQEMKTWNRNKVLWWIQHRDMELLEDNDLVNFQKARIRGSGFLDFDVELFRSCGLSAGAAVELKRLVDEVKKSKFIPQT
jgi:5-methylcytosine-specific restriction endonuclease McrBC GTP-binding regulatory subunit McrB